VRMEASDVLEVAALLGKQRRPHNDLDVVLSLDDVPAAQRLLQERGFELGVPVPEEYRRAK